MNRIYSCPSEFLRKTEEIRKDKKTVFTNGCFDILHPGHIKVLKKAKEYGDILVVGLNSDSSVKKIKGSLRPVNNQKYRAALLSQIRPVDYVIIFDRETPLELIKTLKPQVLVKGGEYSEGKIVGENLVPETVRVKMEEGFSTTAIIKKIIKRFNKEYEKR